MWEGKKASIIERKDHFVVQREDCKAFFERQANGEIIVAWEDPLVEVISFGSTKEARAFYLRAVAAKRTAGKLRQTSKK